MTVAEGIACLGPVTHAGCGALCPATTAAATGVFGPMAMNMTADDPVAAPRRDVGGDVDRVFDTFNVTQFHRRTERRMTRDNLRPAPCGWVRSPASRGEGALNRTARRCSGSRRTQHLRAAPVLRGVLRGRAYTEPPDITHPDLRDLSGGLPDQRVQCDRGTPAG